MHCGSPVHTKPNTTREKNNVANVEAAKANMGTTTVAVTNMSDWVVPWKPALVKHPVALLQSPAKPSKGYVQKLYRGYGSGAMGDPDCGHSTLLRYQPDRLYMAKRVRLTTGELIWDSSDKVHFPLGNLFSKYIGRAASEPGITVAQTTSLPLLPDAKTQTEVITESTPDSPGPRVTPTELKLRLHPKTVTAVIGARKLVTAWTCPADDRSPFGPDGEPGTTDDDCDAVVADWRLEDEETAGSTSARRTRSSCSSRPRPTTGSSPPTASWCVRPCSAGSHGQPARKRHHPSARSLR